jgi:hypothetical protein
VSGSHLSLDLARNVAVVGVVDAVAGCRRGEEYVERALADHGRPSKSTDSGQRKQSRLHGDVALHDAAPSSASAARSPSPTGGAHPQQANV